MSKIKHTEEGILCSSLQQAREELEDMQSRYNYGGQPDKYTPYIRQVGHHYLINIDNASITQDNVCMSDGEYVWKDNTKYLIAGTNRNKFNKITSFTLYSTKDGNITQTETLQDYLSWQDTILQEKENLKQNHLFREILDSQPKQLRYTFWYSLALTACLEFLSHIIDFTDPAWEKLSGILFLVVYCYLCFMILGLISGIKKIITQDK